MQPKLPHLPCRRASRFRTGAHPSYVRWRAMPTIVLVQPQIAGNVGAVLRTASNFDTPVHGVEPFGFVMTEKALRRASMDYPVEFTRHATVEAYLSDPTPARRILMTTRADTELHDFVFAPEDHIIFGNEGSGAPKAVHTAADASVRIPVSGRSLNLSVSVAITLFEALRQTGKLPRG